MPTGRGGLDRVICTPVLGCSQPWFTRCSLPWLTRGPLTPYLPGVPPFLTHLGSLHPLSYLGFPHPLSHLGSLPPMVHLEFPPIFLSSLAHLDRRESQLLCQLFSFRQEVQCCFYGNHLFQELVGNGLHLGQKEEAVSNLCVSRTWRKSTKAKTHPILLYKVGVLHPLGPQLHTITQEHIHVQTQKGKPTHAHR